MSKRNGYPRPKTAGHTFKTWTEEEENKVKVGLQDGKSITEIAAKCGRTEKAIKMRIYLLAEQDISKGTSPDIVLSKYHITKEEFAEHVKTVGCKYAECKNQISAKSTIGYCAQHLNIERVGKQDLDSISAKIETQMNEINNIKQNITKIETIVMAIAKKLDIAV
jgi:hypothetical protein